MVIAVIVVGVAAFFAAQRIGLFEIGATSGGGVLSTAQVEACKFDYGTAFFNMYGGSFDDYDFAKARLVSASKVNKSADDFTNYLYEIPSKGAKPPVTCGIYKRNGKWLSVTKNLW